MSAMRAKMRIAFVQKQVGSELLQFAAVARSDRYPADGSDENNTYAKFSPSGSLTLTVANPTLFDKFKPGEEYYVDFTKAPSSK
jgi:hypothetical protein